MSADRIAGRNIDDDDNDDNDDGVPETSSVSNVSVGQIALATDGATRFYLDGQWSMSEYETFCRSFNDLYRLVGLLLSPRVPRRILIGARAPFHRARLQRLAQQYELETLIVRRITYASPGIFDVAGAGKVAEVAKDTAFGIADRFISRKDRELDRARKEIENRALLEETDRKQSQASITERDDALNHELDREAKEIANDRARAALRSDNAEAVVKEVSALQQIMELLEKSGAPPEELLRIRAGIVAKVQPLVPLIAEGKLLNEPSGAAKTLTGDAAENSGL